MATASAAALAAEKVLILEPSELHFGGPLLRPTITLVTLKNPNNYDVMYKFKTTAPRIYRVRPNLGIVSSHCDKTVRIVLMPFTFELKERMVHKFMILTAPAPNDYSDLRKVWASLDEGKLRCEKFKSIIEMARPMAPIQLDGCSSSTSGECLNDAQMSCVGGDTSASDDTQVYYRNQKTPRKEAESELNLLTPPPKQPQRSTTPVITITPPGMVDAISETTPNSSPRGLLFELRAENEKLRDLNDVLRHENRQLTYELERIRNVKVEMAGSMAGSTNVGEPKRASGASGGGGGKTNKLMLFLATSMTMAIVCAVIGKLVYPEKLNIDSFQTFLDAMVN